MKGVHYKTGWDSQFHFIVLRNHASVYKCVVQIWGGAFKKFLWMSEEEEENREELTYL